MSEKPITGTWTLVAPDGREYKAENPLKCCKAERDERIPAIEQLENLHHWLYEICFLCDDDFAKNEKTYTLAKGTPAEIGPLCGACYGSILADAKRGDDGMAKRKTAYAGLHKDRLQGEFGKIEKKLVDEWIKLNSRGPGYTNILDSLFLAYCVENDPDKLARWESVCPHPQKYPIGPPTDRDKIVAETVIQWLGTNIGREFLRQSGFEYVRRSD